jgi:hypothetical protein
VGVPVSKTEDLGQVVPPTTKPSGVLQHECPPGTQQPAKTHTVTAEVQVGLLYSSSLSEPYSIGF